MPKRRAADAGCCSPSPGPDKGARPRTAECRAAPPAVNGFAECRAERPDVATIGGPSWVVNISLGRDETGGPGASTDAGVLPARRSPPAVAAVDSGRPEPTKSPAQSRVVHAQSADAFRLA